MMYTCAEVTQNTVWVLEDYRRICSKPCVKKPVAMNLLEVLDNTTIITSTLSKQQ